MQNTWQSAWIIGASSGIGRALVLQLASSGVQVAVSARRADLLDELANSGSENILAFPVDVTDREAVRRTAELVLGKLGSIDLAVLVAGVGQLMGATDYSAERAQEAMAINYGGVVNALDPLLKTMLAAGKGQLALVASVAGYRGLPNSAAYAPTKAALISLAESLRPQLAARGVTISVINPGFVATPMTEGSRQPLPFVITADDAAARIIRGLKRAKFEIAFPWPTVALAKTMRLLPYSLFFLALRFLRQDAREDVERGRS